MVMPSHAQYASDHVQLSSTQSLGANVMSQAVLGFSMDVGSILAETTVLSNSLSITLSPSASFRSRSVSVPLNACTLTGF